MPSEICSSATVIFAWTMTSLITTCTERHTNEIPLVYGGRQYKNDLSMFHSCEHSICSRRLDALCVAYLSLYLSRLDQSISARSGAMRNDDIRAPILVIYVWSRFVLYCVSNVTPSSLWNRLCIDFIRNTYIARRTSYRNDVDNNRYSIICFGIVNLFMAISTMITNLSLFKLHHYLKSKFN